MFFSLGFSISGLVEILRKHTVCILAFVLLAWPVPQRQKQLLVTTLIPQYNMGKWREGQREEFEEEETETEEGYGREPNTK